MPYVRIAIDRLQPGAADEVIRRVREGLVPLLQHQPGFIAYDIVKTGEDSAVFINTWETEAQATAAIESAAAWSRANVASLVVTVETYVGELVFTSRATMPGG